MPKVKEEKKKVVKRTFCLTPKSFGDQYSVDNEYNNLIENGGKCCAVSIDGFMDFYTYKRTYYPTIEGLIEFVLSVKKVGKLLSDDYTICLIDQIRNGGYGHYVLIYQTVISDKFFLYGCH